eukprot:TRINITY_DN731_c0_g1_i1.p1 TRINITY_DN731_c0_g1~~TRINITY_DN731_c0_g1_i1.p1  ORF type:complete len:202 (-),score=38.31 TRINITY_DN731_c0_g1_i1:69-674(-)
MSSVKALKLVVVGDGAVGKTCLLIAYANNRFPKEYVPTVFDNYVVTLTAGGDTIELGLWDTAGQEEYDRIRPLSYGNADVFLLCFSVVNPTSAENISAKWFGEIRHYCPQTPILLIGTKSDLRNDDDTLNGLKKMNQQPLPATHGQDLCKRLKMEEYIECSAYTGDNLKLVFDTSVKTVLFGGKGKRRGSAGGSTKRCALF